MFKNDLISVANKEGLVDNVILQDPSFKLLQNQMEVLKVGAFTEAHATTVLFVNLKKSDGCCNSGIEYKPTLLAAAKDEE